jgi:dTDP-4-dehydrorhamnose reductase
LFHLSASGSASWFEFAEAIIHRTRHLRKNLPGIIAIPSQEYPTPARRPMNSRLDTSRLRGLLNVALPAWEEALSECVAELTQDPRP